MSEIRTIRLHLNEILRAEINKHIGTQARTIDKAYNIVVVESISPVYTHCLWIGPAILSKYASVIMDENFTAEYRRCLEEVYFSRQDKTAAREVRNFLGHLGVNITSAADAAERYCSDKEIVSMSSSPILIKWPQGFEFIPEVIGDAFIAVIGAAE